VIGKNETIVTAWAEYVSGPGWSNRPIWVIVQDRYGKLRRECFQPIDQTPEMMWSFDSSYAAHSSMKGAVESWVVNRKDRKK